MNEFKRLKVSAHFLDCRGRACPWPIVQLAKALKIHPEVELWADDPAAEKDVEAFCEATGSKLVEKLTREQGVAVLIFRIGSAAS
jgi:tRNA 2-thiouridine synthesizing protein A